MPKGEYLKQKAVLYREVKSWGIPVSWNRISINDLQNRLQQIQANVIPNLDVVERTSSRSSRGTSMNAFRSSNRSLSSLPEMQRGLMLSMSQRTSSQVNTASGSSITRHSFNIHPDANKHLDGIVDASQKWITKHTKPDMKVRISLEGANERAFSTTILPRNDAIQSLIAKYHEYDNQYTTAIEATKVTIDIYKEYAMAGQGGRSYTIAMQTWKIVSVDTVTNCLFVAAQVCIDKEFIEKKTIDRAKHLKQLVNPTNKIFSNVETIQELANHLKRDIIIYNNCFEVKFHIETAVKVSRWTKARNALEIQYKDNHYIAMLRWKDLGEEPKVEEPKPYQHANTLEASVPIKVKLRPNDYSFKVLSWDIETSVDETGKLITYAVGVYDGHEYASFWGEGCMQQFIDYLYDNAEKYNGYFMYAHNGGKFDAIQLLQEGLLESDKWGLVTREGKNIELNGCWLSLVIAAQFKANCTITLRDSLRLLPGSLDKLCKEFNVEHQKKGDVDHDLITPTNWNKFPQLPEYLEHDVKGLYEVLEKFQDIVYECSKKGIQRSENQARSAIAQLTGKEFKKVRPKWLSIKKENKQRASNLELDAYNEELKLALEYQGEQHFKSIPFFNRKTTLTEIQMNDMLKLELAQKQGVRIIYVNYNEDIVESIKRQLKELNIPFNDIEPSMDEPDFTTCLNITECMTAASLAKKLYLKNYYKSDKTPVYQLTRDIDNYIRKGYRGGRVEIYQQGECPGDKFFYYDFTSLYPGMMTRELPYGKPVYVEHVTLDDILNGSFYGFCKVMAKTINRDIKPIHAVHKDHKLIFPILENPTELTLFSDEIKLGHTTGVYEYTFTDGYSFKKAPFMKEFIETYFKKKLEAEQGRNKAQKQVWKIILNSSYGFWGLRTEKRDGVRIYSKGRAPVSKYIDQGRLISEADIGNYSILRVLNDLDVKDYNVGVAAAITSHARIHLWQLLNDIDNKGHKSYMCDTDSVITSMNLDEFPDLKKQYMWDGTGEDLGALKNELNDLLNKKNIGNLGFDRCILGGAKFYGLRSDEYNLEVCKCKGFNQNQKVPEEDKERVSSYKLTFDQFKRQEAFMSNLKPDMSAEQRKEVIKQTPIQQKQMQFRCGKQAFVNETKPFHIYKKYPAKNILFQYTKGTVHEDGSITPLVI